MRRPYLWTLFIPAISLSFAYSRAGEACTSIMVGKGASTDGSVMTSHTCDSHRTGSHIHVKLRKRHQAGTPLLLTKRTKDNSGPMERYGRTPTGKIPQVGLTYGHLAPAYAAMNEFQVAIGESTFSGRKKLISKKGLIDCETLCTLMLERAKTAREAIRLGGRLLKKYGWNDVGETLTITDPKEVWHMEIVGPGKGKVGAVWVAQRIPDGHIGVVANAARIGRIDLSQPDYFMASKNIKTVAREMGWWDPKSGKPFEFCSVYNPKGRRNFGSTRREWRVLSLLAPSLKLHANSNVFPFSVKPDKPVTPLRIMEIFRDTYEGTDYDMVKNITVADKNGKVIKSPLANPFMPYDMNKVFKIQGGWGWRGERTLARWYCMYVTVTQSRSWLPNPIGGLVWFGYGNTAMTTYVPIYAGVTDLPLSYKTDGRTTGFSRKSAWWAYNRAATLAAQRWGDMRKDVAKVRDPLQKKLFDSQKEIERMAVLLYSKSPSQARKYLTHYTAKACTDVTRAYWKLGDHLWTKYDEKW